MNKFIIKIFILFFSIMGFSQTEIASIKDSLIKKSNQEVLILFEKHEFSNYYLASGYAKILLLRASNTKDSLKIGESYYFLASVTDQKESLAYCDSSITYSKNNYSKIIPIEPLKLKGYWLYQFGEYQKAIDVFVKAYSHTNSEGDVYEKEYLQFQIAGIKSLIGQNHEALRTYKELLKSKDPETVNSSLYNVSNVFLRLKEFDSANYYSKIGIKQPIILKDSSFYYKFLAMNSIADYNLGNIDKSLKTSLEILAHFDGIELANRHYYLGKIYEKKHQNKTKLLHF